MRDILGLLLNMEAGYLTDLLWHALHKMVVQSLIIVHNHVTDDHASSDTV